MIEILKKSIFAGVGLASLTKDKIEELASDIARQANLPKEQAQQFRAELRERSEQARRDLEGEIDRRIDHAFIQAGIVKAGVKKAAEKAKDELQVMIDRRMDEALARLKIARQEDVDALLKRVELLEARIARLSR